MVEPIVMLWAGEFAVGALFGSLWRWRPILLCYAAMFAGLALAIAVGKWREFFNAFDSVNAFIDASVTVLGYFALTVPVAVFGAFVAYGLRILVCRNRNDRDT